LDIDSLILINKEVFSLTKEKHEYTGEGERKIRIMLNDVERLEVGENLQETVLEKVALLIFRIASGQYFHECNKRTALVAGLSFLRMNGFTADVEDANLVAVVDRAGISTATLNDVQVVLRNLIRNV
jgi:death-on-curing protein